MVVILGVEQDHGREGDQGQGVPYQGHGEGEVQPSVRGKQVVHEDCETIEDVVENNKTESCKSLFSCEKVLLLFILAHSS